MKVLVLGGTRFFGKRLVEKYIQDGAEVTILTRGNVTDSFGEAIKRLKVDLTDPIALAKALGGEFFDVVYDNICFGPEEAEAIVNLLDGRTRKYIVTSSLSVYPFGGDAKKESDFDPIKETLPSPYPSDYNYGEGKQLVEEVVFQQATFPCAAVRFPIVLGTDDYTRRLHFHVEHIQQGLPIGLPNLDARMSFIDSAEAASFLYWLGQSELEGPVNATSNGTYTLSQLIQLIEQATGQTAHIQEKTEKEHQSPFGIPASWYMDTEKAKKAGFSFIELDQWFPQLIQEIASEQN